jgi:hypothetical protein
MDSLPHEVKQFKRFLVQAIKIEKVQPMVAYYCKFSILVSLIA